MINQYIPIVSFYEPGIDYIHYYVEAWCDNLFPYENQPYLSIHLSSGNITLTYRHERNMVEHTFACDTFDDGMRALYVMTIDHQNVKVNDNTIAYLRRCLEEFHEKFADWKANVDKQNDTIIQHAVNIHAASTIEDMRDHANAMIQSFTKDK